MTRYALFSVLKAEKKNYFRHARVQVKLRFSRIRLVHVNFPKKLLHTLEFGSSGYLLGPVQEPFGTHTFIDEHFRKN
jgi:murein tripeptide amidase MpaA